MKAGDKIQDDEREKQKRNRFAHCAGLAQKHGIERIKHQRTIENGQRRKRQG